MWKPLKQTPPKIEIVLKFYLPGFSASLQLNLIVKKSSDFQQKFLT